MPAELPVLRGWCGLRWRMVRQVQLRGDEFALPKRVRIHEPQGYREPRRILRPQVAPGSATALGVEDRQQPQERQYAHRTSFSIRSAFVRDMECHALHERCHYPRHQIPERPQWRES
jgi:hypothetical protein